MSVATSAQAFSRDVLAAGRKTAGGNFIMASDSASGAIKLGLSSELVSSFIPKIVDAYSSLREEVITMSTVATGQEDLLWFEEQFEQIHAAHANQWVAIAGGRVVAHGSSFWDALQAANSLGYQNPFIVSADREAWGRLGR